MVMVLVVVVVMVPIIVTVFVKMLMRIMKMDVTFADHLTNQIVEPEKEKRSASNPRKPGANAFTEGRAEQRNRQTESRGNDDVSRSSQRRYRDCLRRVPSLNPRSQNEREPMGRDGGMKKRDPEAGERD